MTATFARGGRTANGVTILYDRIMVIKLNHMIEVIIEINIWKEWILNHVVKKFGWIKINIGRNMIMSCHVIWMHQYQYNIFPIDVFKYILVFMHVVFLLLHKYLVGYWYEYIAMAWIGVDFHTDIGYNCAIWLFGRYIWGIFFWPFHRLLGQMLIQIDLTQEIS